MVDNDGCPRIQDHETRENEENVGSRLQSKREEMVKTMSAEVCEFIREQGGRREMGIAINDGAGSYDAKIIIDCNFKPVPAPLYNYTLLTNMGCFQVLVESRA